MTTHCVGCSGWVEPEYLRREECPGLADAAAPSDGQLAGYWERRAKEAEEQIRIRDAAPADLRLADAAAPSDGGLRWTVESDGDDRHVLSAPNDHGTVVLYGDRKWADLLVLAATPAPAPADLRLDVDTGRGGDPMTTHRSYWQQFIEWEERAAEQGSGMTDDQKTGAAMFRSFLVNHANDDEADSARATPAPAPADLRLDEARLARAIMAADLFGPIAREYAALGSAGVEDGQP